MRAQRHPYMYFWISCVQPLAVTFPRKVGCAFLVYGVSCETPGQPSIAQIYSMIKSTEVLRGSTTLLLVLFFLSGGLRKHLATRTPAQRCSKRKGCYMNSAQCKFGFFDTRNCLRFAYLPSKVTTDAHLCTFLIREIPFVLDQMQEQTRMRKLMNMG